MAKTIEIAGRSVGGDEPCLIVGEIGINHNGDIALARQLISAAITAGCDAVKFQKRTVDVVYSSEELARPRESPFGTTNGELKRALELDEEAFSAIEEHCRALDTFWFASCWDEESVDFIERFDPPCYKIASACLTDDDLLRHHRKYGRPIILSTGMSDLGEIDHAVDVLGKDDLVLLHATSTYPSRPDELNLRAIAALRERYGVPIGYSGHEVGLATTVAARAIGACVVERHITLDRAMWGSDQAASVEPAGFQRLVKDIRAIDAALGDGIKVVYDSEIPVKEKLRRVDLRRGTTAR
jgi:N-acetylneuraminate synthase